MIKSTVRRSRVLKARKGITHYFSSVYTPEQNPEGERMNRTLVECGRCLKHPFNTFDSWKLKKGRL
jgi:hypothetical protein